MSRGRIRGLASMLALYPAAREHGVERRQGQRCVCACGPWPATIRGSKRLICRNGAKQGGVPLSPPPECRRRLKAVCDSGEHFAVCRSRSYGTGSAATIEKRGRAAPRTGGAILSFISGAKLSHGSFSTSRTPRCRWYRASKDGRSLGVLSAS
jgi:hypothetical protein